MALPAFAAVRRAAARLLVTAGRAAIDRYLLHAGLTQSKPAAAACIGRMAGTDGQTDGRTPDRYIDPTSHMRAAPETIGLNSDQLQNSNSK